MFVICQMPQDALHRQQDLRTSENLHPRSTYFLCLSLYISAIGKAIVPISSAAHSTACRGLLHHTLVGNPSVDAVLVYIYEILMTS
jgi:hypothetical protein